MVRVSMRPWPFSTWFRSPVRPRGSAEIVFDIGFQRRLVAFKGDEVIGLLGDDLLGDGDLAADAGAAGDACNRCRIEPDIASPTFSTRRKKRT